MCRSTHATVVFGQSPLCAEGAAVCARALENGSVPADAVPECVRRLGLLVADEAEPHNLRPVEAAVTVRLLAQAARDAAAGYQGTLNAIGDALAATSASASWSAGGGPDVVISHRRPEDVAHALDRAAIGCAERFVSALPLAQVNEQSLSATLRRRFLHPCQGQGVQQRYLYPHSLRRDGAFSSAIETLAKSGVEVRTAAELQDGLTVCDDHTAFVWLTQGGTNTVVEIRHPLVANFVHRVFDTAWSRAEPWRVGDRHPSGAESGQRREIVRLLISGKTDDAIGRHLGLSRRTVAAYVARLSRELGSTSRAQLGFLIAQHGLLDH